MALLVFCLVLSACLMMPAPAAFAEEGAGVATTGVTATQSGAGVQPAATDSSPSLGTAEEGVPSEAPLETPSVLNGWVSGADGWRYYENDVAATGFKTISVTGSEGLEERTYYFNSAGIRQTGWHKLNASWYYFDESTQAQEDGSHMWRGWLTWSNARFYLNDQGHMLSGWQVVEGAWRYFLPGNNGRMQSGWLRWDGSWFYLDPANNGEMLIGLHKIDGAWYCFKGNGSGRMLTGWQKLAYEGEDEPHWRYFSSSGAATKGWEYWDRSWFYLDPAKDCDMLEGLHKIDGAWYCFKGNGSGRMLTGWQKLAYEGEDEPHWRYFSSSGAAARGWVYWDRSWFYLDSADDYKMVTGWRELGWSGGTSWFCFRGGNSGRMITGWADYEGTPRFLDDKGTWRGEAFDQKIREISGKISTSGDVLYNSFKYVASFGYRNGSTYPSGHWVPGYALEMYERGSGNCYRFAALFCMLALANGYDAQVVSGYVPSLSSGWAPHAWVEIRYHGTIYVCDPDFAHEMPGYRWYWITYSQAPVTYRR
jgi:glucan-binding YG repeat protein